MTTAEKRREARQRWKARNPEKVAEDSRRQYQRNRERLIEQNRTTKHGISREQRDWLYEEQDGRCAGCGREMRNDDMDIDHDHACCPTFRSCGGCIRGLLCRSCNCKDVLAGRPSIRFEEAS